MVGTLKTVTMKWKKAGVVCVYEVYEAAVGGIFTARLVSYAGGLEYNAPWSDPTDSSKDACNLAYKAWKEANFRDDVEKPIYGFGSH